MGRVSRRRGAGRREESTGTERASRARDGVREPGVLGGVNAGEMRFVGGLWWMWSGCDDMERGVGSSLCDVAGRGDEVGDAWAGRCVWSEDMLRVGVLLVN